MPVERFAAWHKRFLDVGVRAEYVEYPGVRHNSWDFAYKDAAIFDWFAKFRRARLPERVPFSSRAYKYNAAYWVRLDELTPGTLAAIDARFTAKNRIEVATRNLDGFTLTLAGHAQFSCALPLAVTIDGTALRLKAGAAARSTRARRGGRRARRPARGQAAGAEGPAAEAIAARHIYVYGTADAPGEES